jgi:ABC-type dipeptide/oligopeptide/nickel transport system permease subunit
VLGDENMPIMSKEKRQIYGRKLSGFWQDFSHNKIGIIGLVIIVFYVFIAIAGSYLSPYPAVNTPKAAASYAIPVWMTLLPQDSNLPPTIHMPLNEPSASEEYSEINLTALSQGIISYQPSDGIGENTTYATYRFTVDFNHTYDKPKEFQVAFKWSALFENVSYRLEINITNPSGETFPLLGEKYDIATGHVDVPSTFWNITNGNWLTTSADVELTRIINYERLYDELYPILYNQSLSLVGYFKYYNDTYGITQNLYNRTVGNLDGFDEYFDAFYNGNDTWSGWDTYLSGNTKYTALRYSHYNTYLTYWQRAFGSNVGYADYFQQYWYGNATWSGFWNQMGQLIADKEIASLAADAAKIADIKAKAEADQESRRIPPVDQIFVGPSKYTVEIYLIVKPLSDNASLNINIDSSSKFTIWGSIHGVLGADNQGRDVLTQVLAGTRISLVVGTLAALFATFLEIVLGVASGYLGGLVDETVMRVVDVMLCLPTLPLLLALSAYYRPNVYFIVLLIAIFGWQGGARVIRSRVLTLREMPFVESAKASGASNIYLIFKHLIPNIFPIAIASMILAVPSAIITEAAISFLGFGDPLAPTWGKMLQEAFNAGAFNALAWWYILPPGFGITILCVAFVFVGHAFDEIVNPRLRRRR